MAWRIRKTSCLVALVTCALAALGGCGGGALPQESDGQHADPITVSPGGSQTTEVTTSPIQSEILDPCRDEEVAFSGSVHSVVTSTTTPQGLVHVVTVSNFVNVSGIGLTTGNPYRVNCVDHSSSFSSDGPITTPIVISARILCALAANTALLSMKEQVTITPGGAVAVSFQVDQITCA
jgi:hypothetical protein